jgi:hypothetical protein
LHHWLQKHLVGCVQDAPADIPALLMGALRHSNKVIDKDIDMSNGASMSKAGGGHDPRAEAKGKGRVHLA